jgi:hypothetical protein
MELTLFDEPRIGCGNFKSSWELYGNSKQNETDDNISLMDKYRPKNLKQIFRNKDNIRDFQNWIKLKTKGVKTYDYVLVTGGPGVGKTEFIRLCFQDLNLSVIEYDQSINKAEMEILHESINYSNIEILFSGKGKKAIVIDNFQDNLSTTQTTELLKLLKKSGLNSSPTIFVCSDDIKNSSILKGNVLHIPFQPPKTRDLMKLGGRVCVGESFDITIDALKQFIDTNHSIRAFLSTITLVTVNNSLTVDNLETMQRITQKDIILDTQNTLKLFFKPGYEGSFSDRIRYTSMHTSSIVQENYPSSVNKDISLVDLSKMSDLVSLGEIFKTYMVSNQSWEMSEICGIIGTEAPASVIRANYKIVKEYKIPNKFNYRYEISLLGNSISDLGYCLSYILFPLGDPNKKWIKNMNHSAEMFRSFMEQKFIDKDKSLKVLNVGYSLQDHPPNIIRKIRTKFKNEWKIK